jgi:release factor glutamine methyltransferase
MSQTPPLSPVEAEEVPVRARTVRALRAAGCVFAEDEARLLHAAARTPSELDAFVSRRVAGAPLEHVLGWAAFCGLRILVDGGVFVPRRRTELLVREGAAHLRRSTGTPGPRRPGGRPVVVDLCCGSGAVGVALAASAGRVELHVTDVDPSAVTCARSNVARVGGAVHHGDLYAPLPSELLGRVDLLVVNAPYVPSDAIGLMPPEARLHEPRIALDGGPDGLDMHRRVAAGARPWLAPGGALLIETSTAQARATLEAVERHGLSATIVTDASLDATVVVGTAPAHVRSVPSHG